MSWRKPESGKTGTESAGAHTGSRTQLNQICAEVDAKGRTWLVYLGEKLLKLVAKGNPAAIKELFERIDGGVSENVHLDVHSLRSSRLLTKS